MGILPQLWGTGHRMLKDKGIEIIAADSPNAFVDDTPTATFVRQVLGAVSARQGRDGRQVARGTRAQAAREWLVRGLLLHVLAEPILKQVSVDRCRRFRPSWLRADT